MTKLLSNLIGKKFTVYVAGEFERKTDFLGFMKLLADYSDFFQYSTTQQHTYLYFVDERKRGYIDANISVKLGR